MSFGDVKPRTWGPKANFQETYRQDVLEQEQADKAHLLSVLTKINDRKGETGEVLMTMDEEEFLSRMIREREEIIKEIASEMAELREIMLDIHNLVGEQGFMIDSIEQNIENAVDDTKKAEKDLQEAYKKKKSGRETAAIATTAGVGIGAIILAILFGRR